MVFENGVKNIQAAAYNGARTVIKFALNSNKVEFAKKCRNKIEQNITIFLFSVAYFDFFYQNNVLEPVTGKVCNSKTV